MTIEELEKILGNKHYSRADTVKLIIESDSHYKRKDNEPIRVFKGVPGELIKFEPPNKYTFLVKAASLKAYIRNEKKHAENNIHAAI